MVFGDYAHDLLLLVALKNSQKKIHLKNKLKLRQNVHPFQKDINFQMKENKEKKLVKITKF